ncbi:MAG: nuclear transport factor 2 family protein [Polyangiaceae bacterium]
MSHVQRNIDIVKGIYESFGKQDIPAILERISSDVEWEMGVSSGHGVPWLTPGRGREHVVAFFQSLGQLEFKRFEVVEIMGSGRYVVGLVNVTLSVRANGQTIHEDLECHVWRLDEAGRVTGMRHAADSHAHVLAISGSAAR